MRFLIGTLVAVVVVAIASLSGSGIAWPENACACSSVITISGDADLMLATIAAAIPAATESLPHFLRFKQLQAHGIVDNWVTLSRWIDEQGFPPGRLLGRNVRVWTEIEIQEWLANRPVQRKRNPRNTLPPPAKKLRQARGDAA